MSKVGKAALAFVFFAGFAHADGDYMSPTEERVRISLGAVHTSNSTTLQVDSSTGVPGTTIDGESQFGLDKSDIEPRFQVMFRGGERNRVFLDYFTLDRSGSTIVSEPIIFRDALLQPGDPLQSTLNMRLLTLTYGYSFWHSAKLEISGTIGITAVDFTTTAKVQSLTAHINQTQDAAGPYPTPGIAATWVVSKRFYLDGRVQYLKVNVNDLDAELAFFEFDALYRFRPNVSFALGFNAVKSNVDSAQTGNSGLLDLTSKGPEFLVRVAF